ncbi:uncharacterized membrane protein YcaP (DUF421 family) [Desulfohalotomaculum tongense]|uniref:DUF421 domain-containing protein n=1 Tax=Desulforadius tongensis TaxID=1216062 RepID=UPI00195A855E|nr:DUF421 domain-containing protein [Desulforadius tongensis]MBM7855693.1 uncharacterized membrane protein YcaP (DUF421 family) [Desulforadius tongensis]
MWEIIFRTIVIYFYVLIILRLTGKREIGQLSPFDFVVAIIIAELAAIPMENNDQPLWHGLIPITVLGLLEVFLSWLTMISRSVRMIICGEPQVIIRNGKLLRSEMRKSRYNLDDLMAQLREKGVANIQDVEFGVLENSGRLSVILKSQKRPVTPEDLNIATKYEGLPVVVVMDGEIIKKALQEVNLTEEWLLNKLKEKGFSPEEVLIAALTPEGDLFVNERDT